MRVGTSQTLQLWGRYYKTFERSDWHHGEVSYSVW